MPLVICRMFIVRIHCKDLFHQPPTRSTWSPSTSSESVIPHPSYHSNYAALVTYHISKRTWNTVEPNIQRRRDSTRQLRRVLGGTWTSRTLDFVPSLDDSYRDARLTKINVSYQNVPVFSVSQTPLNYSDIFPKRLGLFSPNFTYRLYIPILSTLDYKFLFNYLQL